MAPITPRFGAQGSDGSGEASGVAGAGVLVEAAAEDVEDSGGKPSMQLISSVTRRREEFEYATR